MGAAHKRYLQEHKRATYTTLLTSDKLNSYLADINEQAEEMFSRLVEQMAEREGVTEQLRADSQMEWVGAMNSIRHRATEIVNSERFSYNKQAVEKLISIACLHITLVISHFALYNPYPTAPSL